MEITHIIKRDYQTTPFELDKITRAIEKAMDTVIEKLKIRVDMGFEYMLGNNWFQCH